jgi:hypothetical protein
MEVNPIQYLKLVLDINLQTYVNNPSPITPLVSSSIYVALMGSRGCLAFL